MYFSAQVEVQHVQYMNIELHPVEFTIKFIVYAISTMYEYK